MFSSRFITVLMLLGVFALAFASVANPAYKIIYNASASMPRGWYVTCPARALTIGSLAYMHLPTVARDLASTRHYLPATVPALKRVVAGSGDRVCERAGVVTINEIAVARALSSDGVGRPLTPWAGCRILVAGQFFVLNTGSAVSFDSRYFGPVERGNVIAVAFPLWTR